MVKAEAIANDAAIHFGNGKPGRFVGDKLPRTFFKGIAVRLKRGDELFEQDKDGVKVMNFCLANDG